MKVAPTPLIKEKLLVLELLQVFSENLLVVQSREQAVWFGFNRQQKMEDVDTFSINFVDTNVDIFLYSVAICMPTN